MRILHISPELAPFAKTGGLADVVGALPRALRRAGHDCRALVPLYSHAKLDRSALEVLDADLALAIGERVYRARWLQWREDPTITFLDCPALYHRGGIYGKDPDEHHRFLALCEGAFQVCLRTQWAPDVLHSHDWTAALVPLLLRTRYRHHPLFASTRTLLSIHNIGYQGSFGAGMVPDLALHGQEYLLHQDYLRQGRFNWLLHGVLYADGICTVSPTYAQEIQTPEYGVGMDPFLRARRSTVVGILNGVDHGEWSPEHDPHLPFRYSVDDLSGKEKNKEALLREWGLPYVPGVPLFGVVSRLVGQKGFSLVPDALHPLLVEGRAQLVVLGTGEPRFEALFADMERRYPRQVRFYRGFSNPLAHRIEASADIFLMPSRYEPCGLNQMYSLRYGTVPIVYRTGGLADSVRPWNPHLRRGTGFVFEHHDVAGLRWAVESAAATYSHGATWNHLMRQGMQEDNGWERRVPLYELLYQRLRS